MADEFQGRVLVAYATNDGSTGEVARFAADTLRTRGLTVDVISAADTQGQIGQYGRLILGGAIYSGRWHRDAHRFLKRQKDELPLAAGENVQPAAPGTGSRTGGAQPCCRLLLVRPGHDVVAGLARSYLFEGMTRDQIEPLAAVTRARNLVRGEHVCHVGDPANEIFVVLSGEVKGYGVDADGEEVIHALVGPGMTFGEPGFFAAEHTRIVAVIASEPTTLLRLDRHDLVPFMERHTGIKDRVLERLASNSRWQTMVIASLATRPLTDRLVLRLLELVDSSPESETGRAVTPKLSQSTLAAMVGVSRENVNRALAVLTADGDIRQEGGRYVLVDEQRLRRRVASEWPLVARRDRRIDAPPL